MFTRVNRKVFINFVIKSYYNVNEDNKKEKIRVR